MTVWLTLADQISSEDNIPDLRDPISLRAYSTMDYTTPGRGGVDDGNVGVHIAMYDTFYWRGDHSVVGGFRTSVGPRGVCLAMVTMALPAIVKYLIQFVKEFSRHVGGPCLLAS